MRIERTYQNLESWDLEEFEDMKLVYRGHDQEVYQDIFAPRWPTYVVELGAPDSKGNRQIVGLKRYTHLEENKERIECRRQVLDTLEYIERVIKATKNELEQGEDENIRERVDNIASIMSNLQNMIKRR